MPEFNYEIVKQVKTLSESNGYTTEVNLIRYGGGRTKLDIRKWNRNEDRMLKGITLTKQEGLDLLEALKELDFEEVE
ncbi:MAG: hypothetical protein IIZ47_05750 [Erysipelotrichaceae bacterium]|nr:hypothetical protein [Erysipelotrichaceae bacterium]